MRDFINNTLFLKKNKIELFKALLYGSSIFYFCQPVYFWSDDTFKVIPALLIFGLSISNMNARRSKIESFLLIFLTILLIISLNPGSKGIDLNILRIVFRFLLIAIFILGNYKKLIYFKSFKYIYSFSLLISIIYYLLVIGLNIDLAHTFIEPLNIGKNYNYSNYFFLVIPNTIDRLRFHGVFDEPGVVGTLSGLILALENFNLKNKINIPILIGGILSFSFFFYLIAFIYLIIILDKTKKIILIITIVIFYQITFNNTIFNTFIWSRFEIIDNNIIGDNREELAFKDYYNSFIKTDNYQWGLGNIASSKLGYNVSSYKQIIVNWGIFGFSLILIFYSILIFGLVSNIKKSFAILILFLGLIYQRPGVFNPVYFFIIISGLYQIKMDEANLKLKKDTDKFLDISSG